LVLTFVCALPLHSSRASSSLKEDETLLFFPTQATIADDAWTIPMRGWVYELEENSIVSDAMIALFSKTFDKDFNEEEEEHFHQSVLPFLVDNERGKIGKASFGNLYTKLGPSTPDGNMIGTLTIPAKEVTIPEGSWGEIDVEAGGRHFTAPIQFVGPTGVSVVSDIDDTVKITVIRDHDETLANTFVRPFRAVEGMGVLYSRWASEGAAIHYVSGSPRQLFQPLLELFESEGFPHGGWYLRTVRVNPRKISEALESAAPIKREKIIALFARYPERKFVLVGDSGESDPEIYADLYRRYPERVLRIFIRDVSGDKVGGARYDETFSGVPLDLWRLFSDGVELAAEKLPLLGDKGE
jgi:hypothetical protein